MKNRYRGLIIVTSSDGYAERCNLQEKTSKTPQHFVNTVIDCLTIILSEMPNNKIQVRYVGDFAKELGQQMQQEIDKRNATTETIKPETSREIPS